MEKEFQVQGKAPPNHDAVQKATGRKIYVDDMSLPGMLYAKVLFSPEVHARIKKIDTSKAEALPGVRAVACYKNVPQVRYNSAVRYIEHEIPDTERIFDDTVRFVGDRVAAVAADTEEIAAAALKLIEVEYEPLPVLLDVEEAAREDAYPIHEGGNIVGESYVNAGDVEKGFAESDYIFEDRYETQAIHHAAMEPHVAIADWNFEDKLTVYSPCQNTFGFRVILGRIFGLPYSRIRMVSPAIGGGFGGKLEMTLEPVAAVLSKMTRQPVKLRYTRKECMLSTRVRHPSVSYVKTGVMKDGTVRAVEFRMFTNTGAYASSAMNVSGAMSHKVFNMYKIPNMRFCNHPVYTNTAISGAMRGYGSPQAYFGMERQFNKIARALDMDPFEFRMKNLVDPDSCEPVFHKPIGNPRVKECLGRARELIHYEEVLAEQEATKNDRFRIGVGVAVGLHGNNCFGAHRDVTTMMLKMNEDGSCILYTGAHDMGNDNVGLQMEIVSEVLGISLERIDLVQADTDACLWNLGDYASRGTFVEGAATLRVAEEMKKLLQEEAAKVLEVPPEEIELSNDSAWWREDPHTRASLMEVMLHCQRDSGRELCCSTTHAAPRGACSYGAHIAKVQVDVETGAVKLLDYAAVHDVGRVLNPLTLKGQLAGGVHMGLGYAISEELRYDADGKPLNPSLKKYHVLKASEMPRLHLDFVGGGDGEPGGPFGAKSMGESPVVPVAPAVVNAIVNAIDCSLNCLPATPERVLAAIAAQKGE